SAAHRTPVIAMTANTMKGDRERCLAVGMDDYVPKPVRMDDLGAILDRWLAQRPGTQAPETEPQDAAGPEAVGTAHLEGLRDLQEEGGPDVLAELIQMFLRDAERSLGNIRRAVAGQDIEALVRAAHTLKGSSANMGARLLSAASLRVEVLARAG